MASPAPEIAIAGHLNTVLKNGQIDIPATQKKAQELAESGISAIILLGFTGRYLGHTSRKILLCTVHDLLFFLGYEYVKLIIGCGGADVQETLEYISEAKDYFAGYALVLAPVNLDREAHASEIEEFFTRVAWKSVLPVLRFGPMDRMGELTILPYSIPSLIP
ncbi:hypothetical protein N7466_003368 [Penicillium verhagenii]|uniref:uncharacterized protein n=1 Tax=Penicillium verhagenii TaxID=1562060 RepID=UPI0025457EFC|nr:uncharacterized protein N7466_003368 [Penicillium verhagenii]KAJ5936918.1 hypothetical protein N7466_003368 [Penicillium verhagenii]